MNELLALVRGFFVAPAETAAVRSRVAPPAPSVAVLGPPRELAAAGPGLALGLARGTSAGVALSCAWGGTETPQPRAPATRRARRLAARLEARGVAAVPSGRLVRVALPDDAAEAFAAAQRAVAAAVCPAAISLSRPREPVIDDLLLLQDAILLVRRPEDPPAITRLAEAGLSGLSVPVLSCGLRAGAGARMLAVAGIGVPPQLRGVLTPAMEAVA